jgi:hypothetical protein
MNQDVKYRKSDDIVARNLAEQEGAVLLNLETGAYFGINPVGLVIWEHIDGERSVTDLVDVVRERVVGGPPDLEADVVAFLNNALERDLILAVD